MNTKIKSGIAIAAILVFTIIIGGLIWLENNRQKRDVNIAAPLKTGINNTAAKIISSFQTRKKNNKAVLYKTFSDSTSEKTGLEVPYTWPSSYSVEVNIVVSPDKTKAVYNIWNMDNLKMEIYLADIDGRNSKLLASQEAGEGSGELIENSLAWSSDEKYITYSELQLTCEKNCRNPGDTVEMNINYQVNVATGEKKALSRSSN